MYAEQGAALAREVGFDASPLVVRSRNDWRAILDLGAEHDARAVVVGSRGQGGLADVLLGSVTSRVVHHADRPVLVVRQALELTGWRFSELTCSSRAARRLDSWRWIRRSDEWAFSRLGRFGRRAACWHQRA